MVWILRGKALQKYWENWKITCVKYQLDKICYRKIGEHVKIRLLFLEFLDIGMKNKK